MKKTVVKVVSTLFPSAIVSFAYKQLTNPQVKKLRDHELAVLDKAHKESYPFQGFDIQLYTWKGGEKKVLLIHGWEGQAGNFSDLVEALLAAGYTVHAFDAPSHGFSSKGSTSLFEFTELVGLLIRKYEVKKLVSHSFGGVATTYALQQNKDLEIDKYMLLNTPDRFLDRIDDVSSTIGITDSVKNRLIKKLEKETGLKVDTLNVSDFVKEINVKKARIIHDKSDRVISIEQSKKVHQNWSVSEHKEIEGTGHFRILRTDSVIQDVLEFLD